ncbi:uncharacterized protein BO95DRAFT_170568 [Aspergillus brunneoviolaceus CBS 621.78]|uniref:Uncharacterized protein n=1 Tax=Aspergillus brunneoviolaceus CBS 621.78 TaxID=1450534 RepID=A0ACD1G5N4_9EURO|nr:hypothetical protein BO95DRAFT_170568 [Aspergillus brunneoviolaceus CBS 621.78]RAH44530.1 hypothetical protein BO95DRAFT_170568 [Aspergillus brunneoviolaceus CBS 621.78]
MIAGLWLLRCPGLDVALSLPVSVRVSVSYLRRQELLIAGFDRPPPYLRQLISTLRRRLGPTVLTGVSCKIKGDPLLEIRGRGWNV